MSQKKSESLRDILLAINNTVSAHDWDGLQLRWFMKLRQDVKASIAAQEAEEERT